MNAIERVLRDRTVNLFNDDWYEQTTLEILKAKKESYGYVYFMKVGHNNNVKIGMTSNLTKRMNSHRTSSNSNIFLIGYIYTIDFKVLELEMHRRFSNKRENGEWFRLNRSECVSAIEKYDGVLIGSFLDKDASFIDGEPTNVEIKDYTDPYEANSKYTSLYKYLNELPKGVKIGKDVIHSEMMAKDQSYESVKQNTITLEMKKFFKANEIEYKELRSGANRYVYIIE